MSGRANVWSREAKKNPSKFPSDQFKKEAILKKNREINCQIYFRGYKILY